MTSCLRPSWLTCPPRLVFWLSFSHRNQFKIIAVYYFEILKQRKTEIMEKIKEYPTPVKGEMMSVADQLRHEGMEQGVEQTKHIAIKNMILKGFDTEFICDILEVSQEKVESVRRNMDHPF